MRLGNFLAGIAVGVIGTYAIQKLKPSYISSDQALKLVKQEMKKQGPIDGSWIHMEPETYVRNNITYRVYKGGISRVNDNNPEQLEFVVNAENGTIIDVQTSL
ncbi:PepSY domain-containing protein [Bacillus pinisoli]|uniref:PepSY domain-containing protein n=1 Tax=Bacillus pinisoli TaxID=2901866 RepID=UPI001FF25EA3|nr:PepSY domain-containing protein [Bacillus pinisoli]